MQTYEYRVCNAQYGRVTFVNAAWQGRVPFGEGTDTNTLIESCPNVWEYLQQAGLDGWELVSVITHVREKAADVQDTLYLKRPLW